MLWPDATCCGICAPFWRTPKNTQDVASMTKSFSSKRELKASFREGHGIWWSLALEMEHTAAMINSPKQLHPNSRYGTSVKETVYEAED